MAKPALVFRDGVVIDRTPAEAFALFADPVAVLQALRIDGVSARKLGNAERWVLAYPEKLGERVIDLRVEQGEAPDRLIWTSTLRGFVIETVIRFEPFEASAVRMRLVSSVTAVSLRAKLMAPILKLGEGRLRRGLRKALAQVGEKLRIPKEPA